MRARISLLLREGLALKLSVFLAMGVVVAWLVAGHGTSRRTGPVTDPVNQPLLVYVGADDCAPCRIWQNKDEPDFRQSRTFARLTYRTVKSPTLYKLLDDGHWPDELREYRHRLRANVSAPLWLIITTGGEMEQVSGLSQWKQTVLPRLEALVR